MLRPRYLLFWLLPLAASGQTIATIAGGGPHNLIGLQTTLDRVSNLATDSAGNLYIGFELYNDVWRLDKAGRLDRVLGNIDRQPKATSTRAIDAYVNGVLGMAFDSSDNLLVNTGSGIDIRKVDALGNVAKLNVNTPTPSPYSYSAGIVTDKAGSIYIADYSSQLAASLILKISPEGTVTTVAQVKAGNSFGTASDLRIRNLSIDSKGNLYFLETASCTVQKVSGGQITIVAGTGECGYNGDGGAAIATMLLPIGLAIDGLDNVYVAERGSVREIVAGQSTIKMITGGLTQGSSPDGTPASAARFGILICIAVDNDQNIYLYDYGELRIWKIAGGVLSTVAGTGVKAASGLGQPATDAYIQPYSVVVDGAGSVLFADALSSSILKVSLSAGVLQREAGLRSSGFSPDGALADGNFLIYPRSLATWKGSTYFTEGNRVRKISGGVLSTVVNLRGNMGSLGDGGAAIDASITQPAGIAVAGNGDVYVAESNRIRLVDAKTGIISTIAGTGVFGSTGDGGPALNALLGATAMSLDGMGNLYFADGERKIRRINLQAKTIFAVAGDGSSALRENVPATQTGIATPLSIAADQSGNLFYADYFNYRIRRIDVQTGTVSTVAGNGDSGFAGDGGPALQASFVPQGIALDSAANLYIADYSGRVRTTKVDACFFSTAAPQLPASGNGSAITLTLRATNPTCRYVVTSDSPFVTFLSGATGTGDGMVTFTVAANNGPARTVAVNVSGIEVTISQKAGTGQDNIGFFQPLNGPLWVLNLSGSGVRGSGDKVFPFAGQAGVTALVGDWNGDGHTKVGYSMNGFWVLDYNGNGVFDAGDKFFAYGTPGPGYTPVVGDWSGDGRSKVGFYNNGFWTLDVNGNGVLDAADPYFRLGNGGPAETPVLGDWNGDKRTKAGVFSNGTWTLDFNGASSGAPGTLLVYNFVDSFAGDRPVVGDWSGNGKTKLGVYRSGSWYLDFNGNGKYDGAEGGDRNYRFGGSEGDLPIIGDWNADGTAKIGTYNAGFWTLDLNGNGIFDNGDRATQYGGSPGDQPLIGKW